MHLFQHLKTCVGRMLRYFRLLREAELDSRSYFRFSTVSGYTPSHETIQRQSEVMRFSHSIEKSLCMPEYRPRSSMAAVKALISILSTPGLRSGIDTEIIATADAVVEAYRHRHESLGEEVADILEGWKPTNPEPGRGGVCPWEPADHTDAAAFQRFFRSRRSMRHFDPDEIPAADTIQRAVELASHAPSVCNRQTWRIHRFTGADIPKILALQNGNRGFGHTIPTLLVVTTDLRYFTGIEERYQPWIEGGIFTMALLLALHSEGLGAVPLNWSTRSNSDRTLHKIAGIPDHHRVICLIGCGYSVLTPSAPVSQRVHTRITTNH